MIGDICQLLARIVSSQIHGHYFIPLIYSDIIRILKTGTGVALRFGIGGISHRCKAKESNMFVSNFNRLMVSSLGAMIVTVILTAAAAGPAIV